MHILFLGNVDTLKEKENQLFPPRGDVGEKFGEVGE